MNNQPFYHRAVILFTATIEVDPQKLQQILRRAMATDDIVAPSVEVEELDLVSLEDRHFDAEPGDPADLP